SLQQLATLRKRLGVRTIFNLLGPLANPAGTPYQLLGVGRRQLLEPMSGALAHLGSRHAFLVCGADGLDEVSLAAPTFVREVRGQEIRSLEWSPRDFGLEACESAALRVSGPKASAELIRAILAGEDGPATRVVLANAAAALLAAERVSTLTDGVALASTSLH